MWILGSYTCSIFFIDAFVSPALWIHYYHFTKMNQKIGLLVLNYSFPSIKAIN